MTSDGWVGSAFIQLYARALYFKLLNENVCGAARVTESAIQVADLVADLVSDMSQTGSNCLDMSRQFEPVCDQIEAVPFRPYCVGVATRTRNVSEYMLVLALCLVHSCDALFKHASWKCGTGKRRTRN